MLPINLLPDGRVLLFMIAVVFLSGIGFGLAPALRASRGELRASVSRHRYRLSRTLVAAQVALSLLLLIGAGLLVRSPNNLHNIDLRFRPEHVLIFELAHNASKRDPASLAGVAEQAYHCVNQVAGVRSASFSAVLLFSPSDVSSAVHIEGYPPGEKRENPLQCRFAAIFQNGGDVPLVQLTRSLRSLEVRTTQPASAIAGPVRQALLEVSKDIMIRRVIALREHVDRTCPASA